MDPDSEPPTLSPIGRIDDIDDIPCTPPQPRRRLRVPGAPKKKLHKPVLGAEPRALFQPVDAAGEKRKAAEQDAPEPKRRPEPQFVIGVTTALGTETIVCVWRDDVKQINIY